MNNTTIERVELPGFPECVTDRIEVPDMAELLMYPNFTVAHADTVWKYGTDFQRMLLSKVPLKNNRKHVTVYSSVHVISKHMRPITTFNPKLHTHGEEWHIDGYEKFTNDHWIPYESIYLFLANTSTPTEFNSRPMTITDPEILKLSRWDFSAFISRHAEEMIVGKSIENQKMYAFSNHIHRAVMPERPEFRYTFRVRETDRDDIPSIEHQMPRANRYYDIYSLDWKSTIRQNPDGSILVNYPRQWLHD